MQVGVLNSVTLGLNTHIESDRVREQGLRGQWSGFNHGIALGKGIPGLKSDLPRPSDAQPSLSNCSHYRLDFSGPRKLISRVGLGGDFRFWVWVWGCGLQGTWHVITKLASQPPEASIIIDEDVCQLLHRLGSKREFCSNLVNSSPTKAFHLGAQFCKSSSELIYDKYICSIPHRHTLWLFHYGCR